jgi:hypothetical protein
MILQVLIAWCTAWINRYQAQAIAYLVVGRGSHTMERL